MEGKARSKYLYILVIVDMRKGGGRVGPPVHLEAAVSSKERPDRDGWVEWEVGGETGMLSMSGCERKG